MIILVVIMGVIVVGSVVFGTLFGRRLATSRGTTPKKIPRRIWVVLGVFFAFGGAQAVWLWWAIEHHHAALGVLVVAGLYFAMHFGGLALRYRRHRRAASR